MGSFDSNAHAAPGLVTSSAMAVAGASKLRVGLISDTHGVLRPQAKSFLAGSDHIIHGGDICGEKVLAELGTLAPVTAVRGNNDHGPWARALPASEIVRVGEIFVYVVHDIADMDIDPVAAGVDVVVTGHSHQPVVKERNGVLYVNPGSSGPRRFRLPIAAGELLIEGRSVSARIIEF